MDGTGDHHVKCSNPHSERQILHVFSHMWNLDLKKRRHESRRGLFGKRKRNQWEGEKEQKRVIRECE
jgi:hypothetical protein